ncbi:MAG: formate dehydrogenase subunit gamma [Nitrospirae bacterium]|nr:MAG: formate dehydrogenase subunit gamma [Nitrospirota bacterium]
MRQDLVQKTTGFERFNHWVMAISFLILFFTGLGFLYHSLAWINKVFGGVQIASDIHKWAGVIFSISLVLSLGSYLGEALRFTKEDSGWISSLGGYFSKTAEPPPQGKMNAGQKIFYLFIVVIGGIAISVSGYILWLSPSSRGMILFGHFLHNLAYVVFAFTVPLHIYLGTAANPGTFRVMTKGTVTKAWAKKHHGKWAKSLGID